MESYNFLMNLAIILLCTKLMGLFSRKLKMPQVVGALLAGLVLGPAGFNLLQETEFIGKLAEMGVIILMFTAGLQTDVAELRKAGKASFVIALIGVLVPLVGGAAIAYAFNQGTSTSSGASPMLQSIFIGVTLTATSVSITVETLRELGKLDTRAGSAILGAALIDDIMGIIALTVVTSMADPTVSLAKVLLKILLFFVFLAVVGFVFSKLFKELIRRYSKDMRRFAIVAFVFCLFLSYMAEQYFGVADITGAYFAGLIICNTQKTKYIAAQFETLSFLLLSPIFFASIGLDVVLPSMTGSIILLTVLLVILAIVSKIVGCGLGAKLCGYSNSDSLQIGVGMVSRGEVALIVADRGNALGMVQQSMYGPVIIVVIVTTIITPILLKLAVGKQADRSKYTDLVESPLVDHYVETEQLDLAQQTLLDMHEEYRDRTEKRDSKGKKPPAQKKKT